MLERTTRIRSSALAGVALLTVTLFCAACEGEPRGQSQPLLDKTLQATLVGAIQQKVPADVTSPEWEDLVVTSSDSKAVTRLRYHWGSYRTAEREDAEWSAVVAVRDSTVRSLQRLDDWIRVASPWWPADSGNAVIACEEIVQVLGPRRDPVLIPVPYRGVGSFDDVGHDASEVRGLHPPYASRGDGGEGWQAFAWFAESARLGRYECDFSSDGSLRLTLTDSVPGVGMLPRGP